MLYKKIHRQHLREFRKGRKCKFLGGDIVYEITTKPHIGMTSINSDGWCLIPIVGSFPGQLWYKEKITWCSD